MACILFIQSFTDEQKCFHLLAMVNNTAVNILYKHLELYKKDLHDPDNHDSVITDLEPDILECEVKWALESTASSFRI